MAISPRRRTSPLSRVSRAVAARRPPTLSSADRRATLSRLSRGPRRAGATRAPEPRAASKAKLTGRAAVLLLIVAVLGVSYASSLRAWLQQRSDVNTLSAQIAASRASIGSLEQAKQRLHDPAYIRTQARERFGWLMPGQTGYRVIDAHGRIVPSGSQLSDPVAVSSSSQPEWWQRAWGSVVAAGVEPAHRHHLTHGRRPDSPAVQIGGKVQPDPGRAMGPQRWVGRQPVKGLSGP